MNAVTVERSACALLEPDRIGHIFPGSWINANFDVWIGAEEDNHAWAQLAARAGDVTTPRRNRSADSNAIWLSKSCSLPKAAIGAGGTAPSTIPPTAKSSTSFTAATWPTSTAF